jgi:hypothetical protein
VARRDRPGRRGAARTAAAVTVAVAVAVAAGTTQRSLAADAPAPAAVPGAADLRLAIHRPAAGRRPDRRRDAAAFSVYTALRAGAMLCLVPAGLLWASPVRRLTTMPAPSPAKDGPRVP